jgi:hypothetical protein
LERAEAAEEEAYVIVDRLPKEFYDENGQIIHLGNKPSPPAFHEPSPPKEASMTSATTKSNDKPAAEKQPATANEVLSALNEGEPEDLNSTGGIQRAVARNRDAIQALANFIDKK